MRIGSAEYFAARQKQYDKTSDLATKSPGDLSILGMTSVKIGKIFRLFVQFFSNEHYIEKLNDRYDNVKTKVEKDTKVYNGHIDEFVANKLLPIREKIYENFMTQCQGIIDVAVKMNADDVKPLITANHPELAKVLDKITDKKTSKSEKCKAFKDLPVLLENHKSANNDTTTLNHLIMEAKGVVLEDTLLKHINENVDHLSKFFTSTQDAAGLLASNWKNVDKFIDDANHKLLIDLKPEIAEWAETMKKERSLLLNTLLTDDDDEVKNLYGKTLDISTSDGNEEISVARLGRYSFFNEQLSNVKKINALQMNEVKKGKDLEKAFFNFVADTSYKTVKDNLQKLNKMKDQVILHYEKQFDEQQKKLNEGQAQVAKELKKKGVVSPITQENLNNLDSNKKNTATVLAIAKRHWQDTIEADVMTLQNQNLALKPFRSDRNKKTLADLGNEVKKVKILSGKVSDDARIYNVKINWEIWQNGKPGVLTVAKDADKDYYVSLKKQIFMYQSNLETMKKDLRAISAETLVTLQFQLINTDPVQYITGDQLLKNLNDLDVEYRTILMDAQDKIDDLKVAEDVKTMMLKTSKDAPDLNKAANDDAQFISRLQKNFNLQKVSEDGNCLFHSCALGIKEIASKEVAYKDLAKLDGPDLRKELYTRIENNPDTYKPLLAMQLSDDIRNFMQMSDAEAANKLLLIPPSFVEGYKWFRNNPNKLSEDDLIEELKNWVNDDDGFKAYIVDMKDSLLFPADFEIGAFVQEFGVKISIRKADISKPIVNGDGKNPIINILKYKSKPHFDFLQRKAQLANSINPRRKSVT